MVVTYVLLASSPKPITILSLSIASGGALSNLFDRIFFDGNVVDFLRLDLGFLRTGIFNAADIAISVGLSLFALTSLGWLARRSAGTSGNSRGERTLR
ncbi:MAG: signal peptidase II [Deltaproteobacteria bacterium]|nr:signal peptidase II [Deltaproteobacteria bacterium]